MDDPLLGRLDYDEAQGGWVSGARAIRFLGGHQCRFVLEGYAADPRPDEIRVAVQNVLDSGPSLLSKAEPHLLAYREDMLSLYPPEERPMLTPEASAGVWDQVQFGDVFHVSRRADGDAEDGIYLSLECSCDWEVEHGLQLVLRDGRTISKLGAFDGHVTNADAYGNPALAGVVYKRLA
jgi:hypothetical protein